MTALISNGVVLVVLGFLAKSLISHQMAKDSMRFQAKMEADVTRSLEEYKSSLEKERIRLQVRYGRIFEQQAEAILSLHRLVVNFRKQLQLAHHADDGNEDEYKAFVGVWRERQDRALAVLDRLPEIEEELRRQLRGLIGVSGDHGGAAKALS